MANRVQGKNVIGSLKISGNYYPIFCAKTLSFTIEQDELETTSVNSGASREYIAGMANAMFEISGVTVLDNTESRISITYLQLLSVRQQLQDWQIKLTDNDGDIIYYLFSGIIRTTSFDKSIPGHSQSSLSVRVSGNISITAVAPPPGTSENLRSDWWAMTAGATSISGASSIQSYSLIGVTVLEVDREGTNFDIITSGTPGNRQAKHDTVAGSISFDTNNPSLGETVFVLFK